MDHTTTVAIANVIAITILGVAWLAFLYFAFFKD